LRAVWIKQANQQPGSSATPPPDSKPETPKAELEFGEEALNEFAFNRTMFEVRTIDTVTGDEVPRSAELNRVERNWFCQRVQEWRKMLSDPNVKGLARSCLMNELYLQRFEAEMARLSPTNKRWKQLQEDRRAMESTYQKQLSDLKSAFPEMDTTGKEAYRRTLSELSKAHRDYYATGDHALIDGMRTADEIEVELRVSQQRPEPQYRFGLSMAISLAMHGINDPNWRPFIKNSVYKKMDAGFKAAAAMMREAMAEPLPDLEKGVEPDEDPTGEYEELQDNSEDAIAARMKPEK
jgi:hypothetical protein